MAEATSTRVSAFDWLRGLAVLFMIQCHALTLLKPEHQAESLYKWLVKLDGLVAPSFIFSAGFSLALVQVRAAMSKGDRGPRIRRSLRRLSEVLGVATLVNIIWFPIFSAPYRLWRLDILHCIALSLFLALPLLIGLGPRPKVLRWVTLALALVVFFLSPLAEGDFPGLNWLLNKRSDSQFPLAPWAGYVYLGASAGATVASSDIKGLVRWLLLLMGIGAGLWFCETPLKELYPPHNFWGTNPANAAQRWVLVLSVLLVFLFFERKVAAFARLPPIRFIAVFGASSMAAYFFHEMALFKPLPLIGFSFHKVWGGQADWALYWVLTAALIGWTFVCVLVADRLYAKYDAWLSSGRPLLRRSGGAKAQPNG
jgi:hypothetical protein